ncbi:MAG: VOC family protein [Cyanophyceae cyanobacterium]
MKLNYIYTRLNVCDYQACKKFYRDVLGFEVAFADDDDEYTEFNTGNTRLSIFDRQKLREFVGPDEPMSYERSYAGVALSFQVHNLDEAVAELKHQGVTIISPPWNFPDRGFLSACFRDPDGNLIELQQLLT